MVCCVHFRARVGDMLRVVEDSMARVGHVSNCRSVMSAPPGLNHAVGFTSGPVHSPYPAWGPKRNLSYKRLRTLQKRSLCTYYEGVNHIHFATYRDDANGAPDSAILSTPK